MGELVASGQSQALPATTTASLSKNGKLNFLIINFRGGVQRARKNRAIDRDIAYLKACTQFSAAWDLAKSNLGSSTFVHLYLLCSLSIENDMVQS